MTEAAGGLGSGASTGRKKRRVLGVSAGPALGLKGPHQRTERSLEARTFQVLSAAFSVVLEGSLKYVVGAVGPACSLLLVEERRARPSGSHFSLAAEAV